MTTQTLSSPSFELGITRILSNLGRFFATIAAAQQAAAGFERLNNRTDAALAAKGLRRTDVSRIVFEQHFG